MNSKALSIYYGLAIFVLATALFVFYPSNPETTAWQKGIQHQLSVAAQQIIGDKPVFTEVAEVYDGVTAFYDQSATSMMAMIASQESDADIYYVFHQVYADFAAIFGSKPAGNVAGVSIAVIEHPKPLPANFMSEEAVSNILPEVEGRGMREESRVSGAVSGSSIVSTQPLNTTDSPWITVQDNFTGQLYCLAVYDGTVNKYLGACKNDYY